MHVSSHDRRSAGALLPDWRALHRRVGSWSPFSDPDLQLAWCELFVPPGDELIVAVRRPADGALVAVLPLFRSPLLPIRRLLRVYRVFGGGGELLINEMPEVTLDPREARRALAAVVAWFAGRDDWDWLDLSLRDDQPWVEGRWLVDAGLDRGVVLHKKAYPSVVLTLPPDGLPPLKRNLKESLRRSRNRMARLPGDWCTDATRPGDPEWDRALEDLVELHTARSAMGKSAPKHSNIFDGTRQEDYLRVLAAADSTTTPRIYRLRHEQTVAALLTFDYGARVWIGASGCGAEHWDIGAVTALQWEAVRDAAAGCARTVVFSVGVDTAKLRWSESIKVRNAFLIAHPRRRSRLLFRLYWLYFNYRSSQVDVSPLSSRSGVPST